MIKGQLTSAGLWSLLFEKLFLGSDYVFYGLGNAELYHGLGRDFNRLSGLRIASHTRFPVGLYQASQARNHEHTVLFSFLDRGFCQGFQERCRGLVVRFQFLRHVADELGLGHACCHLSSLKIEHLRRNMSTFCCTHWVYYISKAPMQAFSPDFMRLFLGPLWKTGINSGDYRPSRSSACKNSGRHRPAAAYDAAAVNQIHFPDRSAYHVRQ